MIDLLQTLIDDLCLSLDYDQTGQASNGVARYPEKQGKRKKKNEGPLGVNPNAATEDATSK